MTKLTKYSFLIIAFLFAIFVNHDSVRGASLTIHAQDQYRDVTHAASGGLYAMYNQNTPNVNLLEPLHPKTFTQAPPGGQQIPNGEPSAGGDFLKVVGNAHTLRSKIIIRLPDIYPDWPYNYSNEQDYLNKVKTMVNAAKLHHDDIYGYELWNEPNGTWQGIHGTGKGNWGDFYQVWQDTYKLVKQLDPGAKIIGPSNNSWQESWMSNFLTMAKNTNTIPDVISWHQWGASSFPQQAQELVNLEEKLGIPRRKISINEYGSKQELAVPGQMIHYLQNFENVPDLDSADLAFWFNYGRMDNLLTNTHQPNGGYWLYKWYGDMTGNMILTDSFKNNSSFASIANISPKKNNLSVIFGGTSGDADINVDQIEGTNLGSTVDVKVESTPWYGVDSNVSEPIKQITGTVPVINGKVTIPVKNMIKSSGYRLTLTNSKKVVTSPELSYRATKDTDPITVEFENGILTGKAQVRIGSYASNNYYVGGMDNNNSSDTLSFSAQKSGQYAVTIGYANGSQQNGVDTVLLNGVPKNNVIFPNTTGWIDDSLNVHGTRRQIKYGYVNLNKGNNIIKFTQLSNFAELDYIKFTPIAK